MLLDLNTITKANGFLYSSVLCNGLGFTSTITSSELAGYLFSSFGRVLDLEDLELTGIHPCQGRNYRLCEFKDRDIVRGRNVVDYKATWTMDVGLNSSVAGHVTSDTGVLGSIPSPVINFHCKRRVDMFIPPIPSAIVYKEMIWFCLS